MSGAEMAHRTVVIEGTKYALVPYGAERIDGHDVFTLPCHVCGTRPGEKHRAACTLGAGHLHIRPANCRDCATPIGAVHRLGCGIEQCPRCGGQYLSCDCDSSEDSAGIYRGVDVAMIDGATQ